MSCYIKNTSKSSVLKNQHFKNNCEIQSTWQNDDSKRLRIQNKSIHPSTWEIQLYKKLTLWKSNHVRKLFTSTSLPATFYTCTHFVYHCTIILKWQLCSFFLGLQLQFSTPSHKHNETNHQNQTKNKQETSKHTNTNQFIHCFGMNM